MLSSFTRDEKKILVFLAVLLGTGSCLNMFWGSRAREPIVQIASSGPPRKQSVTSGTTTLAATQTTASRSVSSLSISGKIDLNLATAEALQTLPGVGPKTAETILAYRAEHGSFQGTADLENVKGIGPAKLKQISPFVEVSTTSSKLAAPLTTARPLVSSMASSSPLIQQGIHSSVPQQATGFVNINLADEETLSSLDYVGPVIARRIVEFRNAHGPFPSVDSMDRVKGIGPRIIAANRHRITVR